MPDRSGTADDDAVLRFIERFGLDLADAGMPRMASRAFAALLVTETGRLDAAELGTLLKVSPAAVSGAVRYLMQVGMVAREREPGRRRDHYRVADDLWYETVLNRDERLLRWTSTMRDGVEAVGPDTEAGRRLDETREFFEFLLDELPELMARWRARRG